MDTHDVTQQVWATWVADSLGWARRQADTEVGWRYEIRERHSEAQSPAADAVAALLSECRGRWHNPILGTAQESTQQSMCTALDVARYCGRALAAAVANPLLLSGPEAAAQALQIFYRAFDTALATWTHPESSRGVAGPLEAFVGPLAGFAREDQEHRAWMLAYARATARTRVIIDALLAGLLSPSILRRLAAVMEPQPGDELIPLDTMLQNQKTAARHILADAALAVADTRVPGGAL